MQARHQFVQTNDGRMEAFVAHPDGLRPFPAVVMYQNVGGLSEILRNMARRVAQSGYYCAVPDLYYLLGKKQNCTAKWQAEIYPGTEHGYAFPGRSVYHEHASELSWERTFAMFKRQLGG